MKTIRLLVPGVLIIALVIIFDIFGISERLRSGLRAPMLPALRAVAYAKTLITENEPNQATAPTEIDRLTVEVAELRVKEQELNELRSLIGFNAHPRGSVIPVHVLGQSIDPEGRVIFIDRGTESGIASGQAAIAANQWIIGTVQYAGPRSASIRLVTDTESAISATLLPSPGHTPLPLVVVGAFGTGAELTLIPAGMTVTPGMVVVTAGLEPTIPAGIIIGKADRELEPNNPPFRRIALSLAPELGTLPRVLGIIRND